MNRAPLNSPFNRNSPDINGPFGQSMSPDFIPFGYSSPLSSIKNNRNFNKPYNKNIMRFQDKSYSSPSSNNSSTFSPNNSNSSNNSNWSGHYNRSNNYNRNRRNQFRNPNNAGYNSGSYFHCSMIEDPWAPLEKKLIEEVGAENIKIVNRLGVTARDDGSSSDKRVFSDDDADNPSEISSNLSTTKNSLNASDDSSGSESGVSVSDEVNVSLCSSQKSSTVT